jgi:Flp pilus assembly protein TadD
MIGGLRRGGMAFTVTLLWWTPEGDIAAQRPSRRPVASNRAMTIRAEMASVLLQSKRYDDAAREYNTLLALDPTNRAYRLGLARSLAWGERLREAEAQLHILWRDRPGDPTVEALLISVRSGLKPGSREAAAWLAEHPESAAYRRILARALVREGRTGDALVHYETLLGARPTTDLYVERAHVYIERRDFAAAERDVHSSIAMGATPEAYVLLGDVHRWRGDLESARAWYVRARVLRSDAPQVAAAFGRLARDQRPPVAYIPDVSEPDGWESTNASASDNLGVNLTTLMLRRGLRKRLGFDMSGGIKALRLTDTDRTLGGAEEGFGADVGISREATHKQFYARARLRAGFVHHPAPHYPAAHLEPEGAFALAAFAGAWGIGAEISTAPAYPSLMTLASLRPSLTGGGKLREESSAISVAGPLGPVDVAARHQSSSMSDGNSRDGLQAYARYPASRPLAVLYSGASLSFAQTSPLYWSPERYVGHGVGLEYALRRVRGFSFAARVIPGVAWATERDTTTGELIDRNGMQLITGIEGTYRTLDWEIGGGLSYGRGRAGDYQRFDALLRARYLP